VIVPLSSSEQSSFADYFFHHRSTGDQHVYVQKHSAHASSADFFGNRDVIQDFSADIIDLLQIDADLNIAGVLIRRNECVHGGGQVHFFADGAGNTIVEGNVDSNLGADFQIELHAFTTQLHAGSIML
jgi:hypothetical protein